MEINFDHHMMSLHEVRNRPGVNWVEVGYYLCNFYELKSRNTAERKKKREKMKSRLAQLEKQQIS